MTSIRVVRSTPMDKLGGLTKRFLNEELLSRMPALVLFSESIKYLFIQKQLDDTDATGLQNQMYHLRWLGLGKKITVLLAIGYLETTYLN